MDIYSLEKITATTIRCSSSFSLCLESSIVSLWFVVCAIDEKKSMNLIVLRIYPDVQHWNSVLPKLETFWRICILPEILGRWYTRRCTVPPKLPDKDGICFCRKIRHEETISCSNKNCPYKRFHPSCLSLTAMRKPKTWYCPHCS